MKPTSAHLMEKKWLLKRTNKEDFICLSDTWFLRKSSHPPDSINKTEVRNSDIISGK